MDKSGLSERKKAFENRTKLYLNAGFDRFSAARIVAGSAGPIAGPALDVGTGKGVLAMAIASLGIDVVSVDIDEDEQVLAELLACEAGVSERIRFIRCDASSLPFPDNHFGYVAMMDVLHHLAKPAPVLKEMLRVVKPGGIIILADFSRSGFELVARIHSEEGRTHPESGATLSAARTTLETEGMSLLREVEGHHHEIIVLKKKL